MDRTTAKRTLGSVFISLPLMFILTALKFYGVPGEGIGELCFLGSLAGGCCWNCVLRVAVGESRLRQGIRRNIHS